MIKYWPNKQGIHLNKAVITICYDTKKKLQINLNNNTKYYLYIDILDTYNKNKLVEIIIQEFKLLLLDLVELNLALDNLIQMKSQIVIDLIEQVQIKFIPTFQLNFTHIKINKSYYTKNLYLQQNFLIEYILIYLLFGSSFVPSQVFPFNHLYTPYEHVQVLLENFTIQLGNILIFYLLNEINELNYIQNILNKYQLCNTKYLATRSIAVFQNNLLLQHITEFYIEQPYEIYSSKYKIFLISTEGIITKYIFISRMNDLQKLSKIQLFFLLFIEIQDILIPKLENILLISTKIVVYTIINIFGSSLIIMIRILINQLKNN